MKCILLVFLFLSVGLLAQNEYNVLPKWKKGDVRYAKHVSNSIVSVNGEIIQNMDVTTNWKMEVIDVGEFFTVEFSSESDQFDIDVTQSELGDSAQWVMNEMLKSIAELTESFVFRVHVDKQNGQAVEMLNSEEFMTFIKEGTIAALDEILDVKKLDPAVINDQIDVYIEQSGAQMIETMLNSLNYLFQCYSFICEIDGTISEEVSVEDVNTLGDLGGVSLPAILNVSSKKKGGNLDISIDYVYDLDEFASIIQEVRPSFSGLKKENFQLEEGQQFDFNMKTTWPNSTKSRVFFELNDPKEGVVVQVEEVTTVVFTEHP
jgi:hypothetical protein